MAHELEITSNGAAMAYAGETPWHSLGKRVSDDLTPAQMMEAAQLNWTVEKRPLEFVVDDQRHPVANKYALVRSDSNAVLDVVGSGWQPTQNETAFNFFTDFVGAGEMSMHTAGSLKNGQIVWALAKVDQSFEILGGDKVDSYLLFSNPHKWGQAIDVRFTPIRVVCNNTLSLSLGQKAEKAVKVSHNQTFDPEAVNTALGIAANKLQQYEEMAKFLASKRYTADSMIEYFNTVFPVYGAAKKKQQSKQAARAVQVVDTQPGAQYGEGSFWQLFNAATYLTDHEIGKSADTRMQSAWYGQGAQRKVNALETAVQLAEAA